MKYAVGLVIFALQSSLLVPYILECTHHTHTNEGVYS